MDIVQTQAQEIAALSAKIEALTDAVRMLCVQQGAHLNKQQLADRLGVHRNTITNMLERGRRMPRPGKWGQIGGRNFHSPRQRRAYCCRYSIANSSTFMDSRRSRTSC